MAVAGVVLSLYLLPLYTRADQSLQDQLSAAVKAGDVRKCTELIQNGAMLFRADSAGRLPLEYIKDESQAKELIKALNALQTRTSADKAQRADPIDPEFERTFIRVLNRDCFAAASQELYGKMAQMALAKDFAAFAEMIRQGAGVSVKKGTEVVRSGAAGDWGCIRIRIRGTTQDLWINDECLSRKR